MKPAFLIIAAALMIWSCSSNKNTTKTSAVLTQIEQDSTVYELIVIDNHFDQWYQLNYSEAKDRSEDYYRSKNLFAVQTWNEFYRLGKYPDVIDSYINYQPQLDYGIELNRKLFWYFKYVEDYYKVNLNF